jgi:hypothetical protein
MNATTTTCEHSRDSVRELPATPRKRTWACSCGATRYVEAIGRRAIPYSSGWIPPARRTEGGAS